MIKKIYEFLKKLYHAEMSFRKWCIFTVAVSLTIVLGAALLVFIVDPFYRYREPFFYDMVYHEIYATAPHLLSKQDYNVLMLGTSMTRNFFLEDIDRAYNCKSIKLAASGGTCEDLCKFFEVAKASKGDKLQHVIWSLDIYPLNKVGNHYSDFDYMYSNDYSQEYRYLFSRKAYSTIFYLVKRKVRPKRQRAHQTDRNRMFATEYKGKPYGLKAVMKDARKNERIHHTQQPYDPVQHQKNFYGRLLPIFANNPQIHFTVYLPPYHIYTYCQSEKFGEADALIRQRTEVMLELLKLPNVELHDFQADPEYVEKHEYFSDVQHFSNIAARRLLADLKSGRRRLTTPGEILANEQALRDLIRKNMPEYNWNIKNFKER